MTLLAVLIPSNASLARWMRPVLAFFLGLARRAPLHALGLARRGTQATKRAGAACGGPGWRVCGQPNVPRGPHASKTKSKVILFSISSHAGAATHASTLSPCWPPQGEERIVFFFFFPFFLLNSLPSVQNNWSERVQRDQLLILSHKIEDQLLIMVPFY